MSSVEETTHAVPAWISDMEFCHVSPDEDDGDGSYCGHKDGYIGVGEPTCGYYDGEAICPQCGNPTCPRCAQLAALAHSLEES